MEDEGTRLKYLMFSMLLCCTGLRLELPSCCRRCSIPSSRSRCWNLLCSDYLYCDDVLEAQAGSGWKGAEERCPPGSLTSVVTALIVVPDVVRPHVAVAQVPIRILYASRHSLGKALHHSEGWAAVRLGGGAGFQRLRLESGDLELTERCIWGHYDRLPISCCCVPLPPATWKGGRER